MALLVGIPAHAATINVPEDQVTIQAATASATPGDTISVACGTYFEYGISVSTDALVIRGRDGDPTCVVVDALNQGRAVRFTDVSGLIQGITFRGGAGGRGGAVDCVRATVELRDCAFTDNHVYIHGGADGGAVGAFSSTVTVEGCRFSSNSAFPSSGQGGALYASFSSVTVDDCIFQDNTADIAGGAISLVYPTAATIRNSVFSRNGTSSNPCAVSMSGVLSGTITGCTFAFNEFSPTRPAEALCIGGTFSIANCIFAFNGGLAINAPPGMATLSCSNIFGSVGGDWAGATAGQLGLYGNISSDPRFCGAAGSDLLLRSDSPCAPGQSGGCGLIGALPVGCGSVAIATDSWGGIKARYR
jgi:hypothetical protein